MPGGEEKWDAVSQPYASGTPKDAKSSLFRVFRDFRGFTQLEFQREISRMQQTAKGYEK